MVRMRVGDKCEWEDIEVGEVFADKGCWNIKVKIGFLSIMILADDWRYNFMTIFKPGDIQGIPFNSIYKLPQEVQNLWRTE